MSLSLSDQENHDIPAKKRKRSHPSKPFAQSQQSSTHLVMDDATASTPSKRLSSVPANAVVAKKPRTQSSSQSQLPVYDDDESSKFEASSAGVIRSVKLINFMCHSHFEIKFNPRINFVSGVNGSGKSAIQTALVVGLGGMASKTNRSSKIEGLIKHGSQSGKIEITLSNNGWNAYKPEEFGRTITIVRHIGQQSNYKIYNQSGKLMATTKKEVENICTRFRIQPNNPVAVLNQDMARNFLSTNKAEDKYSLFRKATLLDEADLVLGQLIELIRDQEDQLESKKRAVMQIKEEIDKMSKKMKLVEELRLSKVKKFDLENELAWTKVNQRRDEMDNLSTIKLKQVKLKNELQTKLDELSAEEEELKNTKKKFEDDIASLVQEFRNKEEARKRLTAEFQNRKKVYEEKCEKCYNVETKLKAKKRDYAELKTSLDDTQRMDMEQRQRKDEATREMSAIEQELDVNESKFSVLNGEMSRLRKITDVHQEEIHKLKGCIEEMRRIIGTCQRQIQSLSSKSDTLSMYEPWMEALVQKVDEAVKNKRFSKPPLGPLGRYIKANDEAWIYAIESNLSIGLLSSFLVNNSEDRKVLYAIMDQVIRNGHKPTVHCSRFQEQKRDRELPDLETSYPNYTNMLRALTINNVIVSNFLMDLRNIHRILLVKDQEACRQFIEHDRNIPRNCDLILDTNATQYLSGYRTYANYDTNRRARILRKSAADQLRGLQEEVAEKNLQITQKNAELEIKQAECKQHSQLMKETSLEIGNLKRVIISSKGKMKELRNIIEMEVPSLQMKLDEIKELEDELGQLERQKQVLVGERTAAQEEMTSAKQRMHAEIQSDSISQETELNMGKDKIDRQLAQLNHKMIEMRKKIAEQDEKVVTLDIRLKEAEDNLATEENYASQLTEDVLNTSRSTSEVQKELKKIETFIEEAKRKVGDEASSFEEKYYSKKENLDKQIKYFKNLADLHKRSKGMGCERQQMIGIIRDANAVIIMTQFQNVLKSRNYKGDLVFDHKARKLDIIVAPIDGGDTLMNTSSLSGGEKSYSTVAFLLALWSNMELPFFSMDEYDVYMDAINRKTITKLLMEFAKNKGNRQFIFLTPLDVSIIQIGDHVQVHKINKIQEN